MEQKTIATTKWVVDPAHSELTFKVKHLMISTITGHFRKFSVSVEAEEEDFTHPKSVEVIIDVDSIYTNNEQRDNHLRSVDFFDTANHPRIVFKGERYECNGEEGVFHGQLTIWGHTHPIAIDIEHGGVATDPYGQRKAAFSVTGKLSRKAFGVTWNAVTDTGGVVVGDEVRFYAEIQLIRQA